MALVKNVDTELGVTVWEERNQLVVRVSRDEDIETNRC